MDRALHQRGCHGRGRLPRLHDWGPHRCLAARSFRSGHDRLVRLPLQGVLKEPNADFCFALSLASHLVVYNRKRVFYSRTMALLRHCIITETCRVLLLWGHWKLCVLSGGWRKEKGHFLCSLRALGMRKTLDLCSALNAVPTPDFDVDDLGLWTGGRIPTHISFSVGGTWSWQEQKKMRCSFWL